jgi:hypothetical protein
MFLEKRLSKRQGFVDARKLEFWDYFLILLSNHLDSDVSSTYVFCLGAVMLSFYYIKWGLLVVS